MGIFKKIVLIFSLCVHISTRLSEATYLTIQRLDERWICNIKTSCVACLKLPHCSWCSEENICFSELLPGNENYCKDNTIPHPTYGMSLEDNAVCACAAPEVQNSCPPDDSEPQCSGRGKCACGRCFCNINPDPLHQSKVIMGEHCEYDNFSCDGPKCNEGPYYKYQKNESNNDDEDVEK